MDEVDFEDEIGQKGHSREEELLQPWRVDKGHCAVVNGSRALVLLARL